MSSVIFDSFRYDGATGAINLASDTFYGMLVTGYTPNVGAHAKRSDVTGEIAGTGYAAGGIALPTVVVTNDTTNHRLTFASGNLAWAASTLSATGLVIYKHRGGVASADNLVCYLDFGATEADSNGTFTVVCPANGWVTLS